MKFNKINKIILFGGGRLLKEFSQYIAERQELELVVFSAKRHLGELVTENGATLKKVLKKNNILFYNSDDVNKDRNLKKEITRNTLGVALGAAWRFEKKTVSLFAKNHLLDFMGIDLPRYRGGAHFTWQILHQNRKGRANLQIIQGGAKAFQKGEIIKRKEYKLPSILKKPIDYFNFIVKREASFLEKFLIDVKKGVNFNLIALREKESSHYPFLSTKFNGLINWDWFGEDIYLFINAFDDPYPGAAAYLNGKKVFLKDCQILKPQEQYHPFSSGIVVRKNKQGIFIATVGSLLAVKRVLNGAGKNIISSVELGDRLYTPLAKIEKALTFKAAYDAKGLKPN